MMVAEADDVVVAVTSHGGNPPWLVKALRLTDLNQGADSHRVGSLGTDPHLEADADADNDDDDVT